MSLRREFVELAQQEGVNMRALCRHYGISPKSGYKWLKRYTQSHNEPVALIDHSRQPHTSPSRTPPDVAAAAVHLRQTHPA